MLKRLLVIGSVSILCGWFQTSYASPSDRTVLYGLTTVGNLVSIDRSTGATTAVRQLPYPIVQGSSETYKNLAVYQGTFLTQVSTGLIAFGTKPNDQVNLGLIQQSSNLVNLSEYPSTGLPRGWAPGETPGGELYDYLREIDPAKRLETSLESSSQVIPFGYFTNTGGYGGYYTCDNTIKGSTFFSSYKSYFTRDCTLHDGLSNSGPFGFLVRVELQNGAWVKTLDVPTAEINIDAAYIADPTSDGILWTAGGYPQPASLNKINVNTTPQTYTTYSPTVLGTSTPIMGLAFGPPVSDVLSPNQEPVVSLLLPWTPIQMLLDNMSD